MLQIDTDSGRITLDGEDTGLGVTQRRDGTTVYTREAPGTRYCEHAMPHARYSLSHNAPRPLHKSPDAAALYSMPAGRAQFEADIRALIEKGI